MRWAGHVARMRGEERCIQGFGRNPEGKRPLGRPRRKWRNNIKKYLQEMGWGMGWIDLASDRDRFRALVNAAMNLGVS